jgi:hypothetical protein
MVMQWSNFKVALVCALMTNLSVTVLAGCSRADAQFPLLGDSNRVEATLNDDQTKRSVLTDPQQVSILTRAINDERGGWHTNLAQIEPIMLAPEPAAVMYLHVYFQGAEVASITLECSDIVAQSRGEHHFAYRRVRY